LSYCLHTRSLSLTELYT